MKEHSLPWRAVDESADMWNAPNTHRVYDANDQPVTDYLPAKEAEEIAARGYMTL